MRAVRDCDILIALYNGDAGWGTEAGENGICHDELSLAYSTAPGKVRLVMLPLVPIDKTAAGARNKRFQDGRAVLRSMKLAARTRALRTAPVLWYARPWSGLT